MAAEDRVILSLCNGTGSWEAPYREAGYRVIGVDPLNPSEFGHDVRTMRVDQLPPIHGVLAAPPCTHLASSGARWWETKGPERLEDALATVFACIDIIAKVRPMWWALENPVGRLPRYLGKWIETFQPCDYGDPYTKRTCLWGDFTMPRRRPVEPTEGSKLWRLGPSEDRWRLRSQTPPAFAQAFFEANR
jgi:hypothetical protein